MTLEDRETPRMEALASDLPEGHPSEEFRPATPICSIKPPSLSNAEKADNYRRVLFQLSEKWRVALCKEEVQYLLQYRYPNEWKTCSYPHTRESLRDNVKRIVNDTEVYNRAKAWIDSQPDYISKKELR